MAEHFMEAAGGKGRQRLALVSFSSVLALTLLAADVEERAAGGLDTAPPPPAPGRAPLAAEDEVVAPGPAQNSSWRCSAAPLTPSVAAPRRAPCRKRRRAYVDAPALAVVSLGLDPVNQADAEVERVLVVRPDQATALERAMLSSLRGENDVGVVGRETDTDSSLLERGARVARGEILVVVPPSAAGVGGTCVAALAKEAARRRATVDGVVGPGSALAVVRESWFKAAGGCAEPREDAFTSVDDVLRGASALRLAWAEIEVCAQKLVRLPYVAPDEPGDADGGTDVETDRPLTVAYAVNYFRRPALAASALPELLARLDLEVLVNNDSISDTEAWLVALSRAGNQRSHVLLYTHDLHEIRGMNRLVVAARSDIVVLAQDDDLPSEDPEWLAQAVTLFATHPRLALLGGYRGFLPADDPKRCFVSPKHTWGYGWWRPPKALPTDPIAYATTGSGVPFMFVAGVNMGPMVVRRSAFLEIGGFHDALSCAGESGIQFDTEFGVRLWEAGWEVGIWESRFQRGLDMGGKGTHKKSANKIREANDRFNNALIHEMYSHRFSVLEHKVATANSYLTPSVTTNRW